MVKKRFALGVLVLAVLAVSVVAEEVTGTIIFEPEIGLFGSYTYSISTGENSRVADKKMKIDYGNVGKALFTLPNYLVKGAKIVYENGGYNNIFGDYKQPMENKVGEFVPPITWLAIITENGEYIELTELFSIDTIAEYFECLYLKHRGEGFISDKEKKWDYFPPIR